jgi:hypothetical protein
MAITTVNWTTGGSSALAAKGGDSSAPAQKDVKISYQARLMRAKRAARYRIRVWARIRHKGHNDKNSSASKIAKIKSSRRLGVAFVFLQFSNWHFPLD